MTNNFFALLDNDDVRRIELTQGIDAPLRRMFIQYGNLLLDDRELVLFDGNYDIADDELLYVDLELPEKVQEAATNAIGIPVLNLNIDTIRALFWYEDSRYYFQTFDKRKLLNNRNILFFSNNTYNSLTQDAFIVDNAVHAVYFDGHYAFRSYATANRIFDLSAFYMAATDAEVKKFAKDSKIAVEDGNWFLANANTVIRKQITLIERSQVLKTADPKKIKRSAHKFDLEIMLNEKGKIIFPNDKKTCREILIFLNEQYYIGLISGKHFKTNSKREA